MKPYKIFLFILGVFLLLGVIGFILPKKGIQIGSITVDFPSPKSVFSVTSDSVLNIEQTLDDLKHQADLSEIKAVEDSLLFFKEFITQSTARLYLPNDNYTFLDTFFKQLDDAHLSDQSIHIIHYGDSQIEIDRISSNFRQRLQDQFYGQGTGIVPAIQTIPTISLMQSYSGDFTRYAMYGDTTNKRASHQRYGPLASFSTLNGNGTITLSAAKYRQTQDSVKTFSRLILLIGNNAANFTAKCNGQQQSVEKAHKGVTALRWDFNEPVSRTSLTLSGTAEIYGVSLEGKNGVVVDNVPMRGCSGTIFTRIDSTILTQAYHEMNVQMIILQYGGNMMPQINSEKSINRYMQLIAKQIQYLKGTNPNAIFMFIGPSDMSKRIEGSMKTYPYLPALNDSLRNTVLNNGAIYWDMFHVMGGENSMSAWVKHSPPWASTDYIHFTDAGAREIATTLSDAFMVYYEFYKLRQTINPNIVREFILSDKVLETEVL